jgi:hypothetical protein
MSALTDQIAALAAIRDATRDAIAEHIAVPPGTPWAGYPALISLVAGSEGGAASVQFVTDSEGNLLVDDAGAYVVSFIGVVPA